MDNNLRYHFDSLLFDMDGTLWDAVDSYCAVWNRTIDDCCPDVPHVSYDNLACLMGKPLEYIFGKIIGGACGLETFMERLTVNEKELMPRLGGRLYHGVRETVAALSRTHRLFMVSNCTADGLPVFLKFTGLEPFFTDAVSYGETGHEKDANIAMLVKKYALERPLYIGDTEGDGNAAHAAGVPFAWASYGFGKNVDNADYVLADITELPDIS